MAEFFAMGGYAFFVWSSFAAALLLIGGVVVYAARELSRTRRETFACALHREREVPTERAGTGVRP